MKITLLTLSLVLSAFICQAQSSDPVKIEQYCEISFYENQRMAFFNLTEVDMGNFDGRYVDSTLVYLKAKSKKFGTPVSILNYLGRAGWKLVSAYAIRNSDDRNMSHYILRKEFLLTDSIATDPVTRK